MIFNKAKNVIRVIPPISWILMCLKYIENKRIAKLRNPYINILKELIGDDICIISNNCFAGRILQDLHIKYNTPTLGLYFMSPDYIEFLQHLEYYLKEAKIQFVEHSKYSLGDERRKNWKHWYPIALLDGKVEIHFLHYYTEKEAEEKWYRRASRVNFNNLFIIGMEQNLCTIDDIKAFDKLPYEHKIFFSTKDVTLKSNIYVKEFKGDTQVGDPYKKAHIFYKYLIEYLNKSKFNI